MANRFLMLAIVALLLVGCSNSSSTDDDADVADVGDGGGDTTEDAGEDPVPDVAEDTGPDVVEDPMDDPVEDTSEDVDTNDVSDSGDAEDVLDADDVGDAMDVLDVDAEDVEDVGDASDVSDDGDVADADDGGDADDVGDAADADDGGMDVPPPPPPDLELLPSSQLILEVNNGGLVSGQCVEIEEGVFGLSPDVVVSISPAEGSTAGDGSWTFERYGDWSLLCDPSEMGPTPDERTIAVLSDALSPLIADVGAAIGGWTQALPGGVAALSAMDMVGVETLRSDGQAIAADLNAVDFSEFDDVLVPLPGGYPSTDALNTAGVAATSDDATVVTAVSGVSSATDALTALYDGLDETLEATESERMGLQEGWATLEAAMEALNALDLTFHGYAGARAELATMVLSVRSLVAAFGSYVEGRASAVDPMDSAATSEVLVGAFEGLRIVGEELAVFFAGLNVALDGLVSQPLIAYTLDTMASGPQIELLSASASTGFAVPGYDTWVYGNGFNSDPSFNAFVIAGDQWLGVIDNAFAAAATDANSIPDRVADLEAVLDDILAAVDASLVIPTTVIEPGTISDQDVYLGPFPSACSGFLPVATLIYPINLATTQGQTWTTNCLP